MGINFGLATVAEAGLKGRINSGLIAVLRQGQFSIWVSSVIDDCNKAGLGGIIVREQ